jgi:hypothetical protein
VAEAALTRFFVKGAEAEGGRRGSGEKKKRAARSGLSI